MGKTKYSKLKNKIENRTMLKEEYKEFDWNRRFMNRKNRGINRYKALEKKRVKTKPTRNWNPDQVEDILKRKTPQFNGEPMEHHHRYSASEYPQVADCGEYIYPATTKEHFYRWHDGDYHNASKGVPLNPNFKEEF